MVSFHVTAASEHLTICIPVTQAAFRPCSHTAAEYGCQSCIWVLNTVMGVTTTFYNQTRTHTHNRILGNLSLSERNRTGLNCCLLHHTVLESHSALHKRFFLKNWPFMFHEQSQVVWEVSAISIFRCTILFLSLWQLESFSYEVLHKGYHNCQLF